MLKIRIYIQVSYDQEEHSTSEVLHLNFQAGHENVFKADVSYIRNGFQGNVIEY